MGDNKIDQELIGSSKNTDIYTSSLETATKKLMSGISSSNSNTNTNIEEQSIDKSLNKRLTTRKSTRKKSAQSDVDPESIYKSLWYHIPTNSWLEFLNSIAPQYKWNMKGRSEIVGLCPWHTEETPSLHLNLTKKIGKCFGCGHVVSNMVQLVSKVANTDFLSALNLIIDNFNLRDKITLNVADNLQEIYVLNEMKKEAAVAFNKVLVDTYNNGGKAPAGIEYIQPAYDYLVRVRKLNPSLFHKFQLGILLKTSDAKQYISPKFHALFESYFATYSNNKFWAGSLVFYYNDSPTTISRFRLRAPILRVDKQKDIVVLPDPYAQNIGFYGMFSYRYTIGRDADIYITEGEFDVLSTLNKQLEQGRIEFAVLGTGGASVTDLYPLSELGVETIYLISDSPKKAGDSWLKHILKNQNNFRSETGKPRLSYYIYEWTSDLIGDDLDEVMKHEGNSYTQIMQILFQQRSYHFRTISSYVKQRCLTQIKVKQQEYIAAENSIVNNLEIPKDAKLVELDTLKQKKVRDLEDITMQWLTLLYSAQDKQALINAINEETGQDFSGVGTSLGAVQNYNTVQGLLEAIKVAFEENFSVSYYETRASSTDVHIWGKKNHLDTVVNPTSIESLNNLLSFSVGSLNEWMERLFPDNPILNEGTEKMKPLNRHLTYKKNCQHIMRLMMESYLPHIPEMSQLTHLGQGIHHMILPHVLREKNIIYFVNGAQIFKATFDLNGQIHWEELCKNTDENLIFFKRLTPVEKWSFVSTTEDFNLASRVDLRDLYFKILDILNFWKFRNHQVIAPYLAAYILSVPLQTVIGNPSLMFITGDPESGKTTLIQNLLGGMKNTRAGESITLVEMSNYVVEASTASLFQKLDKSSLLLCVDESEDTSAHNTKADEDKRELVRALYNMQTGGGKRERGTPDGSVTKTYHLFLPTILAGINPPRDNVFLSRVFMVHTKKEYGHRNVNDAILEKYNASELEEMRRGVTIGLLPNILQLKKLRESYRKELSTIAKQVGAISERFIESIAVPLTILKFLNIQDGYPESFKYLEEDVPSENLNADNLCLNIVKVYKDVLEAIHEQQGHADLLYTCLYAPVIKAVLEDQGAEKVSARDLIVAGPALDQFLNRSKVGIYILRKEGVIVLNWRVLKFGNILVHSKYNTYEIAALVEMSKRNKFVKKDISTHLIAKVREIGGKELTSKDMTVLDIKFLEAQDSNFLNPKINTPPSLTESFSAATQDYDADFSIDDFEDSFNVGTSTSDNVHTQSLLGVSRTSEPLINEDGQPTNKVKEQAQKFLQNQMKQTSNISKDTNTSGSAVENKDDKELATNNKVFKRKGRGGSESLTLKMNPKFKK